MVGKGDNVKMGQKRKDVGRNVGEWYQKKVRGGLFWREKLESIPFYPKKNLNKKKKKH